MTPPFRRKPLAAVESSLTALICLAMLLSSYCCQGAKLLRGAGIAAREDAGGISSQLAGVGDGCRAIFLDVGANQGVHVRMLFEPHLYPGSSALALLDKYFGEAHLRSRPFSETGICAFAFEANPVFRERHQKLEAAYARRGWRAKFFSPAVVSNASGNVTFFINDEPENMNWGSSVVDRRVEDKRRKFVKTELPALDLPTFIRRNVVDRRLPAGKKGKTFMKMDIEGGEFLVLPTMTSMGELCQQSGIDGAMVEEHTRFMKEYGKPFEPWKSILSDVRHPASATCTPTVMETVDDETYQQDPNPIPGNARSN